MDICQTLVAFSEYMNFTSLRSCRIKYREGIIFGIQIQKDFSIIVMAQFFNVNEPEIKMDSWNYVKTAIARHSFGLKSPEEAPKIKTRQ